MRSFRDILASVKQKAGNAVDKAAAFVENGQRVELPEARGQGGNVATRAFRWVYNNPVRMTVNPMADVLVNTPIDVGANIGNAMTGQDLKSYNNMKSRTAKIGYQLAAGTDNSGAIKQQYGIDTRPQAVLGNVAEPALAVMNAATFGQGGAISDSLAAAGKGVYGPTAQKAAVAQIAKIMAGIGAKQGGAMGVAAGLQSGENQSLPNQLKTAAISGAVGAVGGAGAGYATPWAGYGLGKAKDAIVEDLQGAMQGKMQPGFVKIPGKTKITEDGGRVLFRGEGGAGQDITARNRATGGSDMLGGGTYGTPDKGVAEQFGKVTTIKDTSKNTFVVNSQDDYVKLIKDVSKWAGRPLNESELQDAIPKYLQSKGYDSAMVNPAFDEMGGKVLYNTANNVDDSATQKATEKTISQISAEGATRPPHQAALEQALNEGNAAKAWAIYDNIDDPAWKKSMASLMPERPAAGGAGNVPPVPPQTPPTGAPGASGELPKYADQTNINLNKLKLTDEEKGILNKVLPGFADQMDANKGKPLTEAEMLKAAQGAEAIKDPVLREQTKKLTASIIKTRQEAVTHFVNLTRASKAGDSATAEAEARAMLGSFENASSVAAEWGRTGHAFNVEAGNVGPDQQMLEWLAKNTKDQDALAQAIGQVTDWTDQRQLTKLYRQFQKPGLWDIFNEYRYNNMLSGPRSSGRNIFGNTLQTYVVKPAHMAGENAIDFTEYLFTGGKHEMTTQFRDVPKYYAGTIGGFGRGARDFLDALSGKTVSDKFSPNTVPVFGSTNPVNFFTRFQEAQDRFFSAVIQSGDDMMKMAPAEAKDDAAYYLFRQQFDPTNKSGQGALLSEIDKIASGLMHSRASKPLQIFVPFVKIATNITKQWIENSPAGVATIAGNKNVNAQLSKALIGSMVTAIFAEKAAKGEMTWTAPTDTKQKELFYATGRKPMSFKVGDKWIPLYYLGPFAFAAAIPAAWSYYNDKAPGALSDSTWQKTYKSVVGLSSVLSEQSFMQDIGNLTKLLSGDPDETAPSNLGFTASQVLPFNGLFRYITDMFDPYFRKTRTFTDSFWNREVPGQSQKLQPYTEPTGAPSMKNWSHFFAPYDIGYENQPYEAPLEQRTQQLQVNKLISNMGKKADQASVAGMPSSTRITPGMPGTTSLTGPAAQQQKAINAVREKQADQIIENFIGAGMDQSLIPDVQKGLQAIGTDFNTAYNNYMFKAQGGMGLYDQQYQVSADQAYRMKDWGNWVKLSTAYYKQLSDYRNTLDPQVDQKEYLSVTNKMNDLEYRYEQYAKKGGFVTGGGSKKKSIPKLKATSPTSIIKPMKSRSSQGTPSAKLNVELSSPKTKVAKLPVSSYTVTKIKPTKINIRG